MKRLWISGILALAFAGAVSNASAAVEYVRVCSLYGAGFEYIPGTDVCTNPATGDTRQDTEGGVWRTILPYPEGKWVTSVQQECGAGRLVKLGDFQSTDFTLNPWMKKQSAPVNVPTRGSEFVSKVMMQGGFYDPRLAIRSGTNGANGLCIRSVDPTLFEAYHSGPINPPYGDGGLPIGCIANSRIVNMPAAYSISATAAYPNIDAFFPTASQTQISGPYIYGTQLVVTTDVGLGQDLGANLLTYNDTTSGQPVQKPLAGTLSVWVCIETGAPN